MSTKLIVHKYDSGGNKCLYVTINDDDSKGSKFSNWFESKNLQKKRKECEKSARLVVQIVSGEEFNNFDLDSCAKETSNLESLVNNFSNVHTGYEINQSIARDNSCTKGNCNQFQVNVNKQFICDDVEGNHRMSNANNQISVFQQNADISDTFTLINKSNNSICPLEYSLEKVKENNARIMANIQMLNRTLTYTKKKEIKDIVCPKSMKSYPCSACGKCFVYETGLRRHYCMRHAISDIQPRWQIVWTCTECFQVWPRHDLAVKHSNQCCKSDNSEFTREIKTSSLLQCEFCEKVFTSIPRLLHHSKAHTTLSNYECNACEMAFVSYKSAENHWLLCPWLKLYYTFSLPKLLLCNACDRKFRNYDQLYNHRYKVGHFMMKNHCDSIAQTLSILVHQCEICGQWFPSTPQLHAHRSQYHPRYDTGVHGQNELDYNEAANYFISVNNANLNEIGETE